MKDLSSLLQIKRVISPISVADNTPQVGQIIDRQGFNSLTYSLNIGSVADADAVFAVLLEESNDPAMAGATTVANTDMLTQTSGVAPLLAAGFQFDSDNQVRKLGYTGAMRYTRMTVTPTNNTAAAVFSAVAILGHPQIAPVVQAAA